MKVLIVGCGYVGLPLGAELARRGHAVFGLRRTADASGALAQARIQFLRGDVTDRAQLAAIAPHFDGVVNTVAPSGGGPEAYHRTYFQGTQNLIEWLAPAKLGKFVYTSSTGVYGQDDGSLVDERSPAEPEAGTAKVLAAAERLLLAAARERNFPAVVLRVAGIYGPGRGFYLRQMLAGQARLEGDGRRFVNMIHRDDLVGAILAALERGVPGQVYNVCDDEPATVAAVYDWLARELNVPPPPRVPGETRGPARRVATNKRISNRRLREELGYSLKYPTFREGYRAELQARAFVESSHLATDGRDSRRQDPQAPPTA